MKLGHWILNKDHEPVEVDLMTWAMWLEMRDGQNIVKQQYLWNVVDLHVSTIFLGIDPNFSDKGPPILFETMIFGWPFTNPGVDSDYASRHNEWGRGFGYQTRCSTWDEAVEMHRRAMRIAAWSPIWVPYQKLRQWLLWRVWPTVWRWRFGEKPVTKQII